MMEGLITPQESIDQFQSFLMNTTKKRIVKNINYLLSIFKQDSREMPYKAADLKIAMERFGIDDVCHIMVTSDYQLRLYYTGEQEDENNE